MGAPKGRAEFFQEPGVCEKLVLYGLGQPVELRLEGLVELNFPRHVYAL
jgi:hypothetical protein